MTIISMLNNINPQLWGGSFWKVIYFIIVSYSDNPTNDEKQHVKQFFENLKFILPCETCRDHYTINLKNRPLTDEILSSKTKLMKWCIDNNNEVNERLGKPTITEEDILIMTGQIEQEQNKFMITLVLMIVLVIILIVWIKYR
jgi:hypothetical protein